MKKLNLFVPQWQDSGHSNEIYYGSAALRELAGDNVLFETVEVPPDEELELENGIYGYRPILRQLGMIMEILRKQRPDAIFTAGGGCGVEVPVVSYLKKLYGRLDVFWFDAHGDINSPDSSPSGYFHGMPLRFLLERISGNSISDMAVCLLEPEEVTMVGTRDLDPPEKSFLADKGIRMIKVDQASDYESFEKIIRAGSGKAAYIHVDLDVIDPSEFKNVKCPSPGGLSVSCLTTLAGLVKKHRRVAGLSVLENMERDMAKLRTIKPVLECGLSL